jgi:hypothetical protein
MSFKGGRELSDPLAVLRDSTTPHISGTAPTHPSRSTQCLAIATTPQDLPHLTPAVAQIQSLPQGYTWSVQGPEGHVSKRNRRTADKKLGDQRLEGSIHCADRAQKTSTLLNNEEILPFSF